MFVPFVTPSSSSSSSKRSGFLFRRKGGGGGGGGGRGGGGGSKSSGSGSKSSSSSGTKSSSGSKSSGKKSTPSIISGGKKKSSSSYGGGGGKAAAIPAGQLFAGRVAGGGTRGQIFGTRTYGSGYPGMAGRGVAGRGFPFYFWPVAWGLAGASTAHYIYNDEYGLPDNSSRPGGPMASAFFLSSSSSTPSTFRILGDNSTVSDLIADIKANCSSSLNLSGTSSSPVPYTTSPSSSSSPSNSSSTSTSANTLPHPEQVVQYYRASTIALALDGYNNSAVHADEGGQDTPMPTTVDVRLMDCLNQTIGLAAPLIDGAGSRWEGGIPGLGLLGLVWAVWWALGVV